MHSSVNIRLHCAYTRYDLGFSAPDAIAGAFRPARIGLGQMGYSQLVVIKPVGVWLGLVLGVGLGLG